MSELTTGEVELLYARALALGEEAGRNTASWLFDGNTTLETYRRFAKGIEDGDPEILDSVRLPNLSGEFAGDPTPNILAEEFDLDMESDGADELLSELCSEWEDGAHQAFWFSVAEECNRQIMFQDELDEQM